MTEAQDRVESLMAGITVTTPEGSTLGEGALKFNCVTIVACRGHVPALVEAAEAVAANARFSAHVEDVTIDWGATSPAAVREALLSAFPEVAEDLEAAK